MRGFTIINSEEIQIFKKSVLPTIQPNEIIILRVSNTTLVTCQDLLKSYSFKISFLVEDIKTQFIDNRYQYLCPINANEFIEISEKIVILNLNKLKTIQELDLFLNNNKAILEQQSFYIDPTVEHSKEYAAYLSQIVPVGPRVLEIDLTNFCSNNCIYCGLFSDEGNLAFAQKHNKTGVKDLDRFKRQSLDEDVLWKLITELPLNVEKVILGGVGEPFLYRKIFEVIKLILQQGVEVVVYSNMNWMTVDKVNFLHSLVKRSGEELSLICNLPGATVQTYLANVPNQSPVQFKNILENLALFGELFARDKKGVVIKWMVVVNKKNYQELPLFIILAKALNISSVWYKPMEIYSAVEKQYEVNLQQQKDYIDLVAATIKFSNLLKVTVQSVEVLEALITKYSASGSAVERIITNFKNTHRSWYKTALLNSLESCSELLLPENNILKCKSVINSEHYNEITKHDCVTSSNDVESIDGGVKKNYYDQNNCYMADQYLRVFTDQKSKFCCSFLEFIDDGDDLDLNRIYSNQQILKHRSVVRNLSENREHHSGGIYNVCLQCPHIDFNVVYENRINLIKDGLKKE